MLKPLESSNPIFCFMETKSSINPTSLILGLILTFYSLLVELQPLNGRSSAPLMSPPPPPSLLSPPTSLSRSSPPPPRKKLQPPPPPRHRLNVNENRRRRQQPPPPMKNNKMNTGKAIGLLFVGIAAIMQIGVVGLLVYKRRQLLKIKDRYGNCLS
ncbi:hypothetical protein DKX38_001380 [Salix brachista]|uniref:Uncharacterized protein n=1 Tax=Salix brachista TaxID=2182728 RepID=A0A5N5P5Z2_9ROSI|nr:hypothetical protein DKX38_001380 [Salix brachista]